MKPRGSSCPEWLFPRWDHRPSSSAFISRKFSPAFVFLFLILPSDCNISREAGTSLGTLGMAVAPNFQLCLLSPARRCTQTSPIPQFHTAELFLAHGFISSAASQMSKEHLAYPHRRVSRHCAGLRTAFAFEASSPPVLCLGWFVKQKRHVAWEKQPGFIFRTECWVPNSISEHPKKSCSSSERHNLSQARPSL